MNVESWKKLPVIFAPQNIYNVVFSNFTMMMVITIFQTSEAPPNGESPLNGRTENVVLQTLIG
jgi:hypothetical protein